MANKKTVRSPADVTKAKGVPNTPVAPVTPVFPFTFNTKLIILAVLSFIIYANTLGNQYCLDDGIVIEKNMYVQQGFAGIGKIMTTDAYDSYYKEMNAGQQLSGGRYRPLSEVIFAIEHTIFGESANNSIAFQRHLFSVVCYMLAVLAIFYFLSKYLLKKFRYGEDMAFFATLLFAVHPIHTEVVANVKSLDEILSMLFICLTFIFSLRYIDSKKILDLIIGLISFFLSLLAKEYAVTLAVLIPMLFYLLRNKNLEGVFAASWPYFIVFAVYLVLRHRAVGFNGHVETPEILDNPYLLATHTQKIATEIFVLGKYLWLLIVPYPLICDYSYAVIPYQNFLSLPVILTILLYIAAIIWGIGLLVKRNVLAFPIFFYLFCLVLVSNLIMDIGATMGERLIFHSSLGFTILVSYGVFTLIKKWTPDKKRVLVFGLSTILVIGFGYETMARNMDWKNDRTLFTHDVILAPNSTMLNGNAGARFIDMAQHATDSATRVHKLDTAIIYLRKSIALHKRTAYVSSYLNLGDAYCAMQMPDSADYYWQIVKIAYPHYPNLQEYFGIVVKLYLAQAGRYGARHDYPAATQAIYKGIRVEPDNAELWYNLGGAYFTWGKYDSAYYAWNVTLQINPNYTEAKKGLAAIQVNKK
jgi:tetratricopeptide (TPR) repeat protein